RRFLKGETVEREADSNARKVDAKQLQKLIGQLDKLKTSRPEARMDAIRPIFGNVPEPLDAHV
ncbi:MAG TPA: hypothetical protein DEG64_09840, partial [Marinobacter adhaerens]|nr:hypothetical protein [Marinobacter adhaerens]